jgi:predicted RNA-binding Zn-ribbon protein involved in translation (DUF1610 family)
MAITECENCGFQLAESTGKTVRDGTAYYQFVCGECGHDWLEEIV